MTRLKTLWLVSCLALLSGCTTTGKKISYQIEPIYSVSDPEFTRSMGQLLGPPILPGNKAVVLINGDEIFPAMLKAIRSAEKTINFEN